MDGLQRYVAHSILLGHRCSLFYNLFFTVSFILNSGLRINRVVNLSGKYSETNNLVTKNCICLFSRNIKLVFMGMAHSPSTTLYTKDRRTNYYCNLCARSCSHLRPFLLRPCQVTRISDLFPYRSAVVCFHYKRRLAKILH